MADWGSESASCTDSGSSCLLCHVDSGWPRNALCYSVTSDFQDCKALLGLSLSCKERYSKFADLYTLFNVT